MDIPMKYKQLWSKWDIRVLILLSLSIQIILIFLGRLRTTFTSRWVRMVVWVGYLVADRVADFVLGRLSSTIDDSPASNIIIAFWAPFLILHLGGPDTITAYSMEDNELWARHLLGLVYDLFVSFYVLFRSLPNTRLLAPTILIFLVAIIKYAERTYSLYKASAKGFRSSFISSYEIPQRKDMNSLSDQAFWLYSATKPAFTDAIPYMDTDNEIKTFLETKTENEILRLISTELRYAYDEFYTKAVINYSRAGFVLRVFCSICILLAFSLFVFVPKNDFENIDVAITYVLLLGAMCLDVVATVMLVFSNWMIVILLQVKKARTWSISIANCIDRIKNTCHVEKYWSIKMPQLSLLHNCYRIHTAKEAPSKSIMNRFAKKPRLVRERKLYMATRIGKRKPYTLQAMQPIHATEGILKFIISFLQRRLLLSSEEFNKPVSLSDLNQAGTIDIPDWDVSTYVKLFDGLSLDLQILIWHITTELCLLNNNHDYIYLVGSSSEGTDQNNLKMEACKYVSNYMMHRMVMGSEILPITGATSLILIWKAVDDMIHFIHSKKYNVSLSIPNAETEKMIVDEKSLFELARVLAQWMLSITEEKRWQVMTQMWVDLLIKGANNSKANTHVKQLGRGDELLDFIWLFNKHLEIDNVYTPEDVFKEVRKKVMRAAFLFKD